MNNSYTCRNFRSFRCHCTTCLTFHQHHATAKIFNKWRNQLPIFIASWVSSIYDIDYLIIFIDLYYLSFICEIQGEYHGMYSLAWCTLADSIFKTRNCSSKCTITNTSTREPKTIYDSLWRERKKIRIISEVSYNKYKYKWLQIR